MAQLDAWLAQHEARQAESKAATQADDGWTVVRRRAVSWPAAGV